MTWQEENFPGPPGCTSLEAQERIKLVLGSSKEAGGHSWAVWREVVWRRGPWAQGETLPWVQVLA